MHIACAQSVREGLKRAIDLFNQAITTEPAFAKAYAGLAAAYAEICGLVVRDTMKYSQAMRTASAQQVPQQWPEILRWVAAGEEVQVTQHDQVVARVVPAKPVATPDFLARAKAVWGEVPPGKPLSAMVSDARGGES